MLWHPRGQQDNRPAWSSAKLWNQVPSLDHFVVQNSGDFLCCFTQPIYIFSRVWVLHLNRLKEGTWLHSFARNHWPRSFEKWRENSICIRYLFFWSSHTDTILVWKKEPDEYWWVTKSCLIALAHAITMRTNLLNWCNMVSISKNVVFYTVLVVRIY